MYFLATVCSSHISINNHLHSAICVSLTHYTTRPHHITTEAVCTSQPHPINQPINQSIYPFGSYKHSLAPLHTSSTTALPGSKFCTKQGTPFVSFPTLPQSLTQRERERLLLTPTHRKHHHDVPLPLHHDREVEPHLEPPERLVDEHVADLRRGDEARVAGEEVAGGEGAGLDAEGAEDEEGFFCIGFFLKKDKQGCE